MLKNDLISDLKEFAETGNKLRARIQAKAVDAKTFHAIQYYHAADDNLRKMIDIVDMVVYEVKRGDMLDERRSE